MTMREDVSKGILFYYTFPDGFSPYNKRNKEASMIDKIIGVMQKNRVIPVAVFNKTDDALRTAEILLENSVTVLEITMRTPIALDCIEVVSRTYSEMTVGAGSVLDPESLNEAYRRGAVFGVAPCLDHAVCKRAETLGMPFVPGIATPSELHHALQYTRIIKIFPAALLGGPAYLKAISAPFKMKEFYFIPTGGVNNKNYNDYLAVDAVLACGMSYMVDGALIGAGDFNAVADRIKEIRRCMK